MVKLSTDALLGTLLDSPTLGGFEAASSHAVYGYELKMNLKCDASSIPAEWDVGS